MAPRFAHGGTRSVVVCWVLLLLWSFVVALGLQNTVQRAEELEAFVLCACCSSVGAAQFAGARQQDASLTVC